MDQNQQTENLPAVNGRPNAATAALPVQGVPFARELIRSISDASEAVRTLPPQSAGDVTVTAHTATVCHGVTAAEALRAAAAFADTAPRMEIHTVALARVPGLVEGTWEYDVTLIVSSRDPQTGEPAGSTHQGDRRG